MMPFPSKIWQKLKLTIKQEGKIDPGDIWFCQEGQLGKSKHRWSTSLCERIRPENKLKWPGLEFPLSTSGMLDIEKHETLLKLIVFICNWGNE